ncbi:MAG TPA: hypothetical protein VLZ12_07905 [Verrucomicrobiae bacterium]|nr:hypothetical protein [Verrucomicrobiae bacterium]
MQNLRIAASAAALALAACATHVNIASTHREDVSAQARVLAISARNLEDAVRGHSATPAEEEAAQAVAKFHTETEEFARASDRWVSDDNVNDRYEHLIEAWVKMKQTFPNLNADTLTQESYKRVSYEWEKLGRVSGYAGKKYEQKIEQRK